MMEVMLSEHGKKENGGKRKAVFGYDAGVEEPWLLVGLG